MADEQMPAAVKDGSKPKRTLRDLIRDPAWQFWGVLVAAISLGLVWWFGTSQRSVKSLEYGVISNGPLVSVQDNINGRLKISFDNNPVPNVSLVVLHITNDGTIPIQQQDFVRPVHIFFGLQPKAQILSAEVSGVAPSGVEAAVSFKADTVTLNPTLLNAGDDVTLKVLLAGSDGKIAADARIVGISLIKRSDAPRGSSDKGHPLWLTVLTSLLPLGNISLLVWILVSKQMQQTKVMKELSGVMASLVARRP